MKRLLGAIGFAGAMLFAVGSANAALINLTPGGLIGPGGANSGSTPPFNSLPVSFSINLSGFAPNSVNLGLTFGTSGGVLTSLDAQLCNTLDCGGVSNTTYGSVNGSQVGSYVQGAGTIAALLSDGDYWLYFTGSPVTTGFSYAFTVTATTPIPAAALLFASGLGFLGFATKKRKARQEVISS